MQTGKDGEELAVAYLRKKGYEILHTNWRAGRCEVDIIARIGKDLAFVEVKTRSYALLEPERNVNQKKQRMLAKAANMYADRHPETGEIRFDIIAIVQKKGAPAEIEHFEDAFFPFNQNFLFNL